MRRKHTFIAGTIANGRKKSNSKCGEQITLQKNAIPTIGNTGQLPKASASTKKSDKSTPIVTIQNNLALIKLGTLAGVTPGQLFSIVRTIGNDTEAVQIKVGRGTVVKVLENKAVIRLEAKSGFIIKIGDIAKMK